MSAPPPSSDLGSFLERVALPPGWRIVYEPVVTSTMDLAREAARRRWPDRSVFVCDYQTAGRGRLGRRWEAPPRSSLLLTVLLRWREPPVLATTLASVALAEALERFLSLQPEIKWPNDLMLDDDKVAGVLAESYSGPPESYVLLGCGVNVNQAEPELTLLGRPATSLRRVVGRPVHRGELLVSYLERLDAWLAEPATRRAEALWEAWLTRLWGRGRRVRLREGDAEFEAVIHGVACDGALLVGRDGLGLSRVLAGEIVL